MTATLERGDAQSRQELMIALAESGRCIDFWDVEVMLRAQGYTAADTRMATADATTRRALNERCRYARMNHHRQV